MAEDVVPRPSRPCRPRGGDRPCRGARAVSRAAARGPHPGRGLPGSGGPRDNTTTSARSRAACRPVPPCRMIVTISATVGGVGRISLSLVARRPPASAMLMSSLPAHSVGHKTLNRPGSSSWAQARWSSRPCRSMEGGPVDELLDLAVERPVLDQLQVEVGRTLEDRLQPGLTGDDREERHLQAVD